MAPVDSDKPPLPPAAPLDAVAMLTRPLVLVWLPPLVRLREPPVFTPEPATKGRRSESAPTIRDESVMAADRALAASLLG